MNFNLVSRPSEVFTSFRGPLLSFQIVKSVDREKGTLRRWTVFSQGKRQTLVRYLFGKLFWDELNTKEREVFWYLTEFTSNMTMFLCLKALAQGIERKLVRKRAMDLNSFGFNFITRQQYLTIKGRMNYFLFEEVVNLRRVPKFSGYTRHHKDQGSLGFEREYLLSEILEPDVDVSFEIYWEYLTVGKLSLLGGEYSFPEENQVVRNGTQSPMKIKNQKTKR